MDYDFLIEDEKPKTPDIVSPNYSGPNLTPLKKLSRKALGKDVLQVFHKLGGQDWLYAQADADPKGFLELLKKMVPTQSTIDDLQEITVKLINKYGESAEIHATTGRILPPPRSGAAAGGNGPGQPTADKDERSRTATSGNPAASVAGCGPTKLLERF